MSDNTPFFIVGSGRCGTTVLRLMLCSHSRLHIPPETWFIADLVAELPMTAPLTAQQIDRAVDIMAGHYRWPDMQLDAEELRRRCHALDTPKLADILNLVYRHQSVSLGKERFGDKTPRYLGIITELSTLYPGAKFIHLIRDGRDVAISFIDMENLRYYDPDFNWARMARQRRQYLASPYARQVLEVKYEDLVTSPEPTLRKICEFLGEEFEPAMLDWQAANELVPERERSIHRKLGDPLRSDAVGVWRRKLSLFECFAVESCLQQDLRQLGYRLRFSGLGWRPLLIVSGWIFKGLSPLLVRGIPYLQRRSYLPRNLYV